VLGPYDDAKAASDAAHALVAHLLDSGLHVGGPRQIVGASNGPGCFSTLTELAGTARFVRSCRRRRSLGPS
jgi:hypothetical protein